MEKNREIKTKWEYIVERMIREGYSSSTIEEAQKMAECINKHYGHYKKIHTMEWERDYPKMDDKYLSAIVESVLYCTPCTIHNINCKQCAINEIHGRCFDSSSLYSSIHCAVICHEADKSED